MAIVVPGRTSRSVHFLADTSSPTTGTARMNLSLTGRDHDTGAGPHTQLGGCRTSIQRQ